MKENKNEKFTVLTMNFRPVSRWYQVLGSWKWKDEYRRKKKTK